RGYLCAARYNEPRGVWWIAKKSARSLGGSHLERAGEVDRQSRYARRHSRRDNALFALWPEGSAGDEEGKRRPAVSTSHVISSTRTTGEPGGNILRYTLSERVHHWLGFFFYLYCLITGLAFWSPYMYWLAALVGGGPAARFWHPWFGLGFAASMLWMYKMWWRDMRTTEAD